MCDVTQKQAPSYPHRVRGVDSFTTEALWWVSSVVPQVLRRVLKALYSALLKLAAAYMLACPLLLYAVISSRSFLELDSTSRNHLNQHSYVHPNYQITRPGSTA
jgi:hypothetical protein